MTAYYLCLGGTVFCGVFAALSAFFDRSDSAKRLQEVTMIAASLRHRPSLISRIGKTLLGAIRIARTRAGLAEDDKLRQRFIVAGLRGGGPIEIYFAARTLGPVAAIILGSFIPGNTFFGLATLAVVAYLAPDLWLGRAIKGRREKVRRGIPDAVDLLVICVDAGLGLDQAMLRVGQELCISHPEINEEFLQINREQRAGKPRIDAWQSMADRTKLADVASFTSMLMQTEKFGTPIARALSTFADGIRLQRRQRAEEMAAKTTVKMIFPLVLFIFPSLFIVLLAPAFLSIAQSLSGLVH